MDISSSATVKNILASVLQFSVRFIVGIFFIRIIVDHLGAELYGLVALSNNCLSYYALITFSMTSPAGRYLTIALSQNKMEKAKVVFNSSLWGMGLLSFLVVLLASIVSLFAPHFFNFPKVYNTDVRILFLVTGVSFAISTLFSTMALSTFVLNKLYLNSLREILREIIRFILIIFLIVIMKWKLNAVIIGISFSSFIGIILNIYFWKNLTPELRINKSFVNLIKLKEMMLFGWWVFLNQIGALLLLSSEIVMVNLLYGAKMTGMYAPLLLISTTLRSMSAMLSNTLSPMIINRSSKGDKEGLLRMVCRAIRYLGFVIVLPIGLVCGFSESLLLFWLGPEFAEMSTVLMILTIHLCLNLAVTPLFHVQVALKKVRVPAIVTLTMGIFYVLLALLLGSPQTGIGIIGIPLAGAISLTLKNLFFTPYYTGIIMGEKVNLVIRSILMVVSGFATVFLMSKTVEMNFQINSFIDLFIVIGIISMIYLSIMWFVLLAKTDRYWLANTFLKIWFESKKNKATHCN